MVNNTKSEISIIDSKYFSKIKEEIESYDGKREEIVKDSNKIVKLSKTVIYSVHRNNIKEAQTVLDEMITLINKLNKEISKNPKLDVGAYKVAVQEYVEAICYFEYVKNNKLPKHSDIGLEEIDIEYYLLGLCDLAGELSRNAMDSAIKEDIKSVNKVRDFVNSLYDELMLIDLRNSELRRKVDGIRYEVQKLNNLIFDLKMKGK